MAGSLTQALHTWYMTLIYPAIGLIYSTSVDFPLLNSPPEAALNKDM